jgi:glycosyltransferase involved in cell wall biosynthesis
MSPQKKILMICYYYAPMAIVGTLRSLKFSKYLPHFQFSPYVLTSIPQKGADIDQQLLGELPPQVKIFRPPAPELFTTFENIFKYRKGISQGSSPAPKRSAESHGLLKTIKAHLLMTLTTPDRQAAWIPFAVVKGIKLIMTNDIDVLYSSSPPNSSHLAALILSKLTGKPWLADFRDLWSLNLHFERYTHPKLKRTINSALEHLIVGQARAVVTSTSTSCQQMRNHYSSVPRTRFSYIYNGYDPDDISGIPFKIRRKFTVVHVGSFYKTQNPVNFLKGVRQWLDSRSTNRQPELHVIFAGNKEQTYSGLIRDLGLDSVVRNIDYLPHKEAIRLMKSAHVLLLQLGGGQRHSGVIPAKLYEYLAVQRPILALVPDGEAATIVHETNSGPVVREHYHHDIAAAMDHLYTTYYQNTSRLAKFSSKNIGRFDHTYLTQQLANVLTGCLESSPP